MSSPQIEREKRTAELMIRLPCRKKAYSIKALHESQSSWFFSFLRQYSRIINSAVLFSLSILGEDILFIPVQIHYL